VHVENIELQKKIAILSQDNIELQKKAQQLSWDEHSPTNFSNRIAVAIPPAGVSNEPVQLQLAQPLQGQDETPMLL
jgi:hypothetical protein